MQAPLSFWSSPHFTDALIGLLSALTSLIYVLVSRMQSKQSVMQAKQEETAHIVGNVKADQDTMKAVQANTADKVDTIVGHTNGIVTALQTTINTQVTAAQHVAEIADKDRQIAQLKADVHT